MRFRRAVAVVLLSLLGTAFTAWAWIQYESGSNHLAVRGACEGIEAGTTLNDALARFKPLGEHSVQNDEGGLVGLMVVRVRGPAACRCKIVVENGKVRHALALCAH